MATQQMTDEGIIKALVISLRLIEKRVKESRMDGLDRRGVLAVIEGAINFATETPKYNADDAGDDKFHGEEE
jgi:hypothetical protein